MTIKGNSRKTYKTSESQHETAKHTQKSNMTHKRKSVSEVRFATGSGNGFKARIVINKKYTSGPTRPTIELAYADSNAARAGAIPYEDVAAALLKQLLSSPMAVRHYRQQGLLSKTVSLFGNVHQNGKDGL